VIVSVPPGQLLMNQVLSKLPVSDDDTIIVLLAVAVCFGEDVSDAVSVTVND
jgi:hypothetical protein